MAPSVLLFGVPHTSPRIPDHMRESLEKMLINMDEDMKASPYDWEPCFIDLETPFVEIIEKLRSKEWDIVVLGGGLRMTPSLLPFFEKLVNTVHEEVPKAKMAFNSTPENTQEACRRVMPL